MCHSKDSFCDISPVSNQTVRLVTPNKITPIEGKRTVSLVVENLNGNKLVRLENTLCVRSEYKFDICSQGSR